MGDSVNSEVPHQLMNPREFTWRGSPHVVCRVTGHGWVNEETWRVRALAREGGYPGVFDLRFDWTVGRWSVTRISTLELEAAGPVEQEGCQVRPRLYVEESEK